MATATVDILAPPEIAASPGYWGSVGRRLVRDPVAMVALAVILIIVAAAVFAPWLAPADPLKGMMTRRLKPIGFPGYLLGTDELGRDMLSRLMWGGRLSLFMGVTPVLLAFAIGSGIGIFAGYVGGWVNTVVMRTIDVFFAFPSVLLAIALSGALGAGILNSIVSLTVVFVPQIARVAESVTTQIRERDYVEAARISGANAFTIVRVHVLGNVLGPDLRLRHQPDQRLDDPVLGPLVPRSRREAAGAGMGPDAEYAAHRHLFAAADRSLARRDDLPDLDLLQHVLRWSPIRHGSEAMSEDQLDPRDRGGAGTPLLAVNGLLKHFGKKKSLLQKAGPVVRAVDGVDFTVAKGETLGIVGESGCGKSTTARLVMQIIRPDAGDILFDGEAVGESALSLAAFRKQVQMVFQDSYASLNPRLTVEDTIAFGPKVHGQGARAAVRRAHDLLHRVGLEPGRFAARYPHEISGGQRQRVNIARALALEPRLLILDEAVSALDKSVEAQVLNLLLDLKEELNLTYMFISHDLNVVRFMSDRVMVMYLGKVAELGPSDAIFASPRHPYTTALLASMPSMDPDNRTEEAPLTGDPPNPINPPPGCRFHTRCHLVFDRCPKEEPGLNDVGGHHLAACHLAQPMRKAA